MPSETWTGSRDCSSRSTTFAWTGSRAAAIMTRHDGRYLVSVETEVRPKGVPNELRQYWNDPNIGIIDGRACDPDPARINARLPAAQKKGKVLAERRGQRAALASGSRRSGSMGLVHGWQLL